MNYKSKLIAIAVVGISGLAGLPLGAQGCRRRAGRSLVGEEAGFTGAVISGLRVS
jgi:hypothetical protein